MFCQSKIRMPFCSVLHDAKYQVLGESFGSAPFVIRPKIVFPMFSKFNCVDHPSSVYLPVPQVRIALRGRHQT